jgi:hypothetical protein
LGIGYWGLGDWLLGIGYWGLVDWLIGYWGLVIGYWGLVVGVFYKKNSGAAHHHICRKSMENLLEGAAYRNINYISVRCTSFLVFWSIFYIYFAALPLL